MTSPPQIGRRAIRGTALVIAGHLVNHGLRLLGNLILTRLLFPEAFGLMALVQVVIVGIYLLSDLGLRGSIVYHERGEDAAFLNTAWTVQIIRGLAVWIVVATAASPLAVYYDKPALGVLLPVVGCSAFIEGFASTARFTLIRRISPGRQVALEVGARLLSLCIMAGWALLWPSVWALVAGALAMSLATATISHALLPGYANRLMIDRASLQALFQFGRWIMPSTVLSFLLSQGDRLILGKILSPDQLGVYAIAFLFTEALLQPVTALAGSILQPLYARLAERGSGELRTQMFRARALIFAFAVPAACILAVFGRQIIQLLYDGRYWDAGWMLQILSLGAVGGIVCLTADRVMLAVGDSLSYLKLQLLRSGLFLTGVLVGLEYGGLAGFLIGLSCARIMDYVPLAYFLRRHGVWLPGLDLPVIGAALAVIGLGAWLVGV